MKLLAVAPLAVASFLLTGAPSFADPDALAKIVDGKCVPDQQTNGKPGPCAEVDVKAGYAILKDINGATQFLLIAATPETGIEAPDLEGADAPNYFEDAWQARHFIDDKLGRKVPREDIALAINSTAGRSQNRLHIHIDCVRIDVMQQLRADAASIQPGSWTPVPSGLLGHPYQATRIDAADLVSVNPFALVAAHLPMDDPKMGDETIVAVATVLPDGHQGFYLLSDHAGATAGDNASGEELLDHDCAILK